MLNGRAPTDLGVHDGRLKPPSDTPNSVSSQSTMWAGHAQARAAQIAPLALIDTGDGDGSATMARLRAVVAVWPGARVAEERSDYLRVQFETRWLKFVDDAEFWFDPQARAVQLRSASRLGRRDFGVNRERIEAIRSRLSAP